jgi:hypothetical protein
MARYDLRITDECTEYRIRIRPHDASLWACSQLIGDPRLSTYERDSFFFPRTPDLRLADMRKAVALANPGQNLTGMLHWYALCAGIASLQGDEGNLRTTELIDIQGYREALFHVTFNE